ncbi:MAG: glycosyltransferase [Treponema sp.]|nr:glycosyltransferase [Treponema sp.]
MKLCLLAPRFPFPENGGDVVRINSIARYLKGKGNELILISFCFGEIKLKKEYFDLYDTIYIVKKRKFSSYIFAVLFALCRKPMQCGYYFSTGFLRQFRRTLKNECPDECVAHLLRMVPYLESMKVQKKSVVEMTDALSKTYSLSSGSKQMSLKKIVYALELGLIKKYEKHVMQTFPKIVLVSKADIEYLKECADVSGKNLYCHANGVSVNASLPRSYNPNKICFVGNMRTLQNQDAVIYFVSEVFPIIRKANPDATFHIVGAEPPEKIRSLADRKSIFVTGFVENLEKAISDSCVAVAPVRIAAGIQNKVLVAMGCGIPVVMTSLISKAIPELADRKNCLIRDSAESTAEICIQLMQDTEFRGRISLAGYETVRKCYSWNERLEGYEEIPGT